jgi:hypothetical protein
MESKMQLVLTEDQDLLAKTAADWVAEKSPVARVRALRDSNDPDGFSRTLWKEMAELGWVGIPFSEEQGGAEMGVSELAVVLEALGRTLAPEPFIGNVMLAGSVLQRAGSEAQQKEWLPRLCEGESILALAQQERGSRFDLHRVARVMRPIARESRSSWCPPGPRVCALRARSGSTPGTPPWCTSTPKCPGTRSWVAREPGWRLWRPLRTQPPLR